jgi:nucleotidyltransferase substrate binding protein (TIGR01987 family)
MSQQRFEQRRQQFQRALQRLREALAMPYSEVVRDGVIQRFEFTFELLWKTLQVYLQHLGYEASSPRRVLREAFEAGIIPSDTEGDGWMAMLDDRNLTSHTYEESLAEAIYQRIVNQHTPLLEEAERRLQDILWEG